MLPSATGGAPQDGDLSEKPASHAAGDRDGYLCRLGERVREERARRGMTRRILARDSGLSERYLAQLDMHAKAAE